MRGANVDNVCITSNTVFQIIKVDGRLASGEQRLQLFHGYSIVLGVVECEVADLEFGMGANRY